ncbi:uncharacterized protein [Porites lutea]|uniref:uncharacterized protein isoform X2 n=1 Tax=Porites lutea TaxID=51062 RepID=UPI003CC62FFD
MILTGVVGIIASFNRAPAGQMRASVLAFIAFSIISTTLCLETVGYYIYTFAASWDVYRSSRSYLIIAFVTYILAIVEVILGVFAAIFGFLFIAHRGKPRGNQVAAMPENDGEDLWDENSQQQMDQVNPPDGFVAGMKTVYKNIVNGDEWGLARNHDKSLYYYKIITGEVSNNMLPQNQPSRGAPDGYLIMSRNVYRKRNYDEEWLYFENGEQVTYCLLGRGESTLELPQVKQNESLQNDAGVNDGIAGQDNQPILQE